MMSADPQLGEAFAKALAAKNIDRLSSLIHPEVAFRGMTPSRTWDAADREALLRILLGSWFEDTDEIQAVDHLETDSFADRQRVGYRFCVNNPDGLFLVEQQAFLTPRGGQIGWMRVLCSGFRRVER